MISLKKMLVACFVGLMIATSLLAAAERPLLMEGKKTLYQRVLAKPGARIADKAGDEGVKETVPFTVFYVYERKQIGDDEWLRVGTDQYGGSEGWISSTMLISWNQTLTISFRDPAKGSRVLLFRDKQSLKSLIDKGDTEHYRQLYQDAVEEKLPADSPVVGIQPAEPVDITEDFYLVPILDHEDVYLGSEAATMLKVTSVPLASDADVARDEPTTETVAPETRAEDAAVEEEVAAQKETTDAEQTSTAEEATAEQEAATAREEAEARARQRQQAIEKALADYKSGLVFVIDATKSMQPYIERTRQAVRGIYDRLQKAGVTSGMSFGVVAFRDDPEAAKGLEYRSKMVVDLKQGENADSFFSAVEGLKAADVSSKDFIEDAYAGVATALDRIDWRGRDARYIVLITDAGARGPDDKLSGTGLDAERLNRLARDKHVVLLVLHLLTPQGKKNHAAAAAQYRRLSAYPGVGSLYYGVPTGDVAAFGKAVDAVARQIGEQVHDTVAAVVDEILPEDEVPAKVAGAPEEPPPKPPQAPEQQTSKQQVETVNEPPSDLAELQSKLRKLGYALRMEYLARRRDGKVPEIFNAWLVDHDFLDPERQTVDVRVLLTRDQLSDLHDLMRQIIDTFQEGLITPQNFLDNIRKLAATLSRDPDKLADSGSLSEMGFMKEYIEDLPYRSEAMKLTLEDWAEWPARRQIEYINRLESKIAYYKALYDHTDLWVSLDGGPVDGQSVFPVELDMLP